MKSRTLNDAGLETIIRKTPDGMVVVDGEGMTCFVNPAAEALFGLGADRLLGQSFGHPIGKEGKTEIQIIRGFREPVQAEMNIAEIELEGAPATLISLRDITARKQMEAALRENEARLLEAKEAADAANHAKSQFLANMSHELRTPLNAILGYAQLLIRDPDISDDHREAAVTIHNSGEHLLTLISDLLDIAKIEAGKIVLESETFDFRAFLQSMIEPMAFRAREKNVSLILDAPRDLPGHVRGDEKRLRQVLLNLLSNAVKFTEKGQVAMRVRYEEGRAHFEVADTGLGIPAEALKTIFNPFEQGIDAVKGGDGTGLGLAISATLARMMGGEIVVESAPGKGSAFRFAIPMEKTRPSGAAAALSGAAASNMKPILGPGGRRLTALIVDDNMLNRALARGVMTRLGFNVIQSQDGSDAVQKAAEIRPDVVLLDLFMPVMDGFRAGAEIRQTSGPERPVIMALSADVSTETKHRCAEVGFDDFIEKPMSLDELSHKLRHHFSQDGSGSNRSYDQPPDASCRDAETLAALAEMAAIGDIGGVRGLAERQKAADPASAAFYERLIECARQFRIDEVDALIRNGAAKDRVDPP